MASYDYYAKPQLPTEEDEKAWRDIESRYHHSSTYYHVGPRVTTARLLNRFFEYANYLRQIGEDPSQLVALREKVNELLDQQTEAEAHYQRLLVRYTALQRKKDPPAPKPNLTFETADRYSTPEKPKAQKKPTTEKKVTGASKLPNSTPERATKTPSKKETKREVVIDKKEDILAGIIGMDSVRKELARMVLNTSKAQQRMKQGLIKVTRQNPFHIILRGYPGTGKTTVARRIAKSLKEIGFLKTDAFVEVQRSSLVAGFVGQTALTTRKRIHEAAGGVLFVDEAYRLISGGQNDFGQEAIDELMSVMQQIYLTPIEDSHSLVSEKPGPRLRAPFMIFAGYPELMRQFEDSNEGFFRRVHYRFDLPPYTPHELAQILLSHVSEDEFLVEEDVTLEFLATLIEKKVPKEVREKRLNGGLCDDVQFLAVSYLNEREEGLETSTNVLSKRDFEDAFDEYAQKFKD